MNEMEYDTLGPITAYRAWYRSIGKLRSITTDMVWEPEPEPEPAVHFQGPANPWGSNILDSLMNPKGHIAPESCCCCGYYALKRPEDLAGMIGASSNTVLGEVECWGKVIEHNSGYRAQYMRIKRLFVVGAWNPGPELAEYYGAELVTDLDDPVLHRITEALDQASFGDWSRQNFTVTWGLNTTFTTSNVPTLTNTTYYPGANVWGTAVTHTTATNNTFATSNWTTTWEITEASI